MPVQDSHRRVNDILLGPLERPLLAWLAARMPGWVTPDVLTFIGIGGSLIIFGAYVLSNLDARFLWMSSAGFIVNWFGDSLDGTVARYRHIERPKYGFFVDHTVDAFSQLVIFAGIGLSPYVSFSVAMLALTGYLLMSVLVYVDTYVSGVFKISYGKFGPTEMRLIAIVVNGLFFFLELPKLEFDFGSVVVYDILVAAVGLVLISVFALSTIRRAIELSEADR